MKWIFTWVAASVLVMAAAGASEGIALPAWKGNKERTEMIAGGWLAGATLLTDTPAPGEPVQLSAVPLELEPPQPGEISEEIAPFPEVAEKFLPAYFAKRPETFLVDPQALLSPSDYRDRLNFLNFHASDSAIDLYVYVFGGDQEIPSAVRQEEIAECFFSEGRPAVIVYYYLGAPQRSVVYLNPSAMASISSVEQHRALESSVMQALERTRPAEQFEKFLVQMSIRVYWMERNLAGESATGAEISAALPPTVSEKRAAVKSAKRIWLQEGARQIAGPVAMLFAAFFGVWGLRYWLMRRARYRFPEFEIESRLGGDHAAGIGAVISFGSAAVPPASQRDQVPDYLRRA